MGGGLNNPSAAGGGITPVTLVVAANDSLDTTRADYVCSGVNDDVEIQQAIDALPATGGSVVLLDGTYNIEASLVLDSYQTLQGCGRNTILTTTTNDVDIVTATGGGGTEKVGITISDLCVDGTAGGAVNDINIQFTFVDFSTIYNVWIRNSAEYGIDFSECDWDIINNCHFENLGNFAGCRLSGSDYNTVGDNVFSVGGSEGIYLNASLNNTIVGNIFQGFKLGISLQAAHSNVISGNSLVGNTRHGLQVNASRSNTIIGNNSQGNTREGIWILGNSHHNLVDGNTVYLNEYNGIFIDDSDHCLISNNHCYDNSKATDLLYDNIRLRDSEYNSVTGNLCRISGAGNEAAYGIHIQNAGVISAVVIGNDLYNSGKTANFNDAGAGTKLAVHVVPFSDGTDPQDSGYEIDVGGEFARAWLRLPAEVQQVVRMNVYARSVVAEVHEMELEMVVNGGADNEAFNTHSGSIAQLDSASVNFAADDIIYWINTEAGTLLLVGGDSVEVKVLHEAAEGDNCQTDAFFRTVEIEYV